MTTSRDPGRASRVPPIATVALGLVVYALAVGGLYWKHRSLDFEIFYRALQLFVLEGAALEGDALAPDGANNGLLKVVCFLAPLMTVFALLVGLRSDLRDWLRRRLIASLKGHIVVCGDGEAALALAHNLRGPERVVLVRSTSDGPPTLLMVIGDARDPEILKNAGIAGAKTLYACSGTSAVNAAVALTAGVLGESSGGRLAMFAQVRSDDMVEALRVRRMAAQVQRRALDFFTLDDVAARVLLTKHPVGEKTPVVVGFGSLGQAVVRAVVRAPGRAPEPHEVVVAQAAAPAAVGALGAGLEAAARGWTVRTGAETEGDGLVYVCLPDEDEAVATALRLARPGTRTVVVCLRRASPFAEALDGEAALKVFGVLDEACKGDVITEDSIVLRTARAIHERYAADARGRGDTRTSNPSVADWRELPGYLRESNIAQAEHVGTKLLEIGACLTTRAPTTPFEFTENEVESLARMEHTRWVQERKGAGFVYGPNREGRFHPDLVRWSELSAESQQKDVAAVRQLPDLLAAEGLYIERSSNGSATGR